MAEALVSMFVAHSRVKNSKAAPTHSDTKATTSACGAHLEGREVGLLVALVVAVQVPEHGGPGSLERQNTLRGAGQLLPLLVQQHRVHAEEGQCRGAWLRRPRSCGGRQGNIVTS